MMLLVVVMVLLAPFLFLRAAPLLRRAWLGLPLRPVRTLTVWVDGEGRVVDVQVGEERS